MNKEEIYDLPVYLKMYRCNRFFLMEKHLWIVCLNDHLEEINAKYTSAKRSARF